MKAQKKKEPVLQVMDRNQPFSFRTHEAEKYLRRFCASTSDELARVLATIFGEVDFALGTENVAIKDRSLSVAAAAAEHALVLARNLRYFAVHTRLDVQVTDLSQLLLDTFDLFEKDLESRNIRPTLLIETSSYVIVDPNAIQQILSNILSHASQQMTDGGKLNLTLRHNAKTVEIVCSDNAPAMSPEQLAGIFAPYPESASEDFKGRQPELSKMDESGLGLSVAKALVDAHGGQLSVESSAGVGNTFTIHLPYDSSIAKPAPFTQKRRFRRARVSLLVEFSLDGSPYVRSELTTLSVSGGFIAIPDPSRVEAPQLNSRLSVRISYFWNLVLEIPVARVASVRWTGTGTGIGVEFLELGPKVRKILAAIVKSHAY